LPHLTAEEYDPGQIIDQIFIAAKWNQGRNPQKSDARFRSRKNKDRKWDYKFVRLTFDDYERHLRYIFDHLKTKRARSEKLLDGGPPAPKTVDPSPPELLADIHSSSEKCTATNRLLSPKVLANAIRSLTRSKMDTDLLSQRIRDIERLVGNIGWTPITEELSYRLLEANGKAGNVRRTLALLDLRKKRGYSPREQDHRTFSDVAKSNDGHEVLGDDDSLNQATNVGIARGEKEFIHAINSIISAQLPLRRSRNIYLHESSLSESSLDNPTRYLDAVLLNMSQRGVPLRTEMANQMLSCYASTGRTGRALHYFYKVVRDPVEEDGFYIPGPHPTHLSKAEVEAWIETRRQQGIGRVLTTGVEKAEGGLVDTIKEKNSIMTNTLDSDDEITTKTNSWGGMSNTKPRMIMHPPPPFHKIPSNVKETLLARSSENETLSFVGAPRSSSSSTTSSLSSLQPTYSQSRTTKTKYEWEVDREWSISLTAAFAFADSLTHGACGHAPIELNVGSWNCLIKACCYRGAFHRALKILNETMPQKGIEPDSFSYNTILAGLARVGDVPSLKELLVRMTNRRVPIDKYTVQAISDGLLNVGDISGASTAVQDIFNQHDTLPPYTTHLKIIEFALSNGLIFEAKRHVYFIQQLWKWQPSPVHDNKFCEIMKATQRNPKLSKEALQKLFRYFGEELRDEDFF
jgi:pentatricopeptide repeat protein